MYETNASGPGLRAERVREMERLFGKAEEFATTVRTELDELDSLRKAAVEEARDEAADILDRASRDAQRTRAQAEDTARATLEEARAKAEEATRLAQQEVDELVEVSSRYRQVLATAMSALDSLPNVPAATSAVPDEPPARVEETNGFRDLIGDVPPDYNHVGARTPRDII